MAGERAIARERGEKTYFNGNPCKYGHTAERRTGCGTCMTCYGTYFAKHYQENKDAEKAARHRDYEKNKQAYIDAARRNAKPYIRKTEGVRNKSSQPGYSAAMVAKRRALKLQRTPAWADLDAIEKFYNDCPEGYEVDHIVPLNGEFVSGLHVRNNLQYLTKSQNASKGNRYAV